MDRLADLTAGPALVHRIRFWNKPLSGRETFIFLSCDYSLSLSHSAPVCVWRERAPNQMSNFTIPVLPRKEIVAILAESQIANITENDLLNPTPDIVSSMYTALLMHLDSLQYVPSILAISFIFAQQSCSLYSSLLFSRLNSPFGYFENWAKEYWLLRFCTLLYVCSTILHSSKA